VSAVTDLVTTPVTDLVTGSSPSRSLGARQAGTTVSLSVSGLSEVYQGGTVESEGTLHGSPLGKHPESAGGGENNFDRLQHSAAWLAVLPPAFDCLRGYQRNLIADLRETVAAGIRRVLLQAPTGSGKTHIIAAIVAAAASAGLRVLILATRTRIVWQIHERLEAFAVVHGVIAAALPDLNYRGARVQIASVDTLYRRSIVDAKLPLPDADAVFFDEAHLSLGASRVVLLERYANALHVGFTATPAKVSGRPLSERFDELIVGPSVKSLIASCDLVRPRIFSAPAATERELASIPKDAKTGDFAIGQLGELMARPKLVGDVVQNWLRIANARRTLVFACNKAHGAALVQEFLQVGVAAELLTDQDSEPDREAAIYRLETGTTKIIVNCFLLSYGTDMPTVEAIVLARPTRSVVLYLQSIGRGMRPAPGKDHVIVIDHGRVVESLGMPDSDFGWSLDEIDNVNIRARSATAEWRRSEERARTCPDCMHIWLVSEDGPGCTCCGWMPKPKAKPIAAIEADLREINGATTAHDAGDAERFYREALGYYARRWPHRWRERANSARWWAWMKTRKRFNIAAEKPPGSFWRISPTPPSAITSGWLLSREVAWRKCRELQACT
jgi:DNA repair protein RadD